jgi:hypothetical protein
VLVVVIGYKIRKPAIFAFFVTFYDQHFFEHVMDWEGSFVLISLRFAAGRSSSPTPPCFLTPSSQISRSRFSLDSLLRPLLPLCSALLLSTLQYPDILVVYVVPNPLAISGDSFSVFLSHSTHPVFVDYLIYFVRAKKAVCDGLHRTDELLVE